MRFRSVQTQIAALCALCAVAAITVLVTIGIVSNSNTQSMTSDRVGGLVDDLSRESLERLAQIKSESIQVSINEAFDAARAMARSFEVLATGPEDTQSGENRRQKLNDILKSVLVDNATFNGTYSAWEPGALDGRDRDYVGRKDAGSDATGRFLPYWTRDPSGRIGIQPLVEYDSEAAHPNGVMKGGWYIGPKNGGGESILAPLPYIVQGRQVFLSTMSIPITVNEQFAGVVGADFDLVFMQRLAEEVKSSIYGGAGSIDVVTKDGLIIASTSYPEAIGGRFDAVDADLAEALASIANRGEPATIEHGENITAVAPVPLGRNDDAWSIVISVPTAVAMAQANDLAADLETRGNQDLLLQVGAGLVVGLLALLAGWLAARGLANPIRRMTDVMSRLASGDTSVTVLGADRRDEIGEMAEAVETFKMQGIERERLGAEAETARKNEILATERQAAIESAKAEDLRVLVTAVETSFDRLSEGDLTIRMNQKLAPEFEPIRVKFNDSVSQLEEAIGGVVSSVQTIRTGLSEIAVASNDLSQRTEQQAASIEETVAALSDVSRGVAETAQNAGKARETARTAAAKAEEGGTIVGRAVSAMEEIEGSSQKINDIIGVIDEIAFQTNLLALNAGVEAARAGEAGKGFAVVAQEVRELAQRSATAAKEIKDLISTSREKVGTGVDLVTASGRSLEEIVAEVNAMAEVISTIASSATEQASSLREVSGAADQMDKVTQQNAAMVEETTAATKNVEAETDMLATSVARFAISAGGNRSSQSGRTPAASRPAAKPAAKPSVAAAGSGQKPVASPVHAMQDRLAKGTAPKRAAPAAARGANALARKDEDWTEF